jgi:hypothetical protein
VIAPTGDNAEDLLMLVQLWHVVDRYPEVENVAGLPIDRRAIRQSPADPFVETE